jgi:signal transduction histidine kinase
VDRLRGLLSGIWPVLRLRTVMFGLLLLVAALPGIAAIMLRVYENALVRRTEAELIAQSSALAASAAMVWPGARAEASAVPNSGGDAHEYQDIPTSIDLRSSPVLPERPDAAAAAGAPDPAALAVSGRMAPVLAATKQATLAAILLLDRQGFILNGRDTGRSLAALPEVRQALGGRPDTVLRRNGAYTHPQLVEWISRGTDVRMHHARPIVVDSRIVGVVLVSRSPRALFRGMWEDRGKIAAGTGTIFLLLVVMTALLSRAIVRPIEALSRATRALAEGRQAEPPKPTLRVREIDGLIQDFGSMAAAIEQRAHYLRDFAAALAHEFKTPLAGLRGGIELMQDHASTMTGAEQARFLANMASDANRLNRLISRLMELAKAEVRVPGNEGSCDIPDLLARLRDGLSGGGFAITVDASEVMPALAFDASALETVLTTLIENARQAGSCRVDICAATDGAQCRITLTDNGQGIPAGDVDRIFEPFFTSKRAQGGTGLGLPIARALIEGKRGQLDYRPGTQGACFVILLPL